MWPMPFCEVAEILLREGCFFEGKSKFDSKNSHYIEYISGAFTDSRKPLLGGLFVAIVGESHDGHNYVEKLCKLYGNQIGGFLVEASWYDAKKEELRTKFGDEFCKQKFFACEESLKAFRGLAAAVRQKYVGTVVGIGGSNGKTTTKEMISALLGEGVFKTQKSENGFLGVAITLCSPQFTKNTKYLVLEIGIDEPGAMEQHLQVCKPDIVCLTALGPEHLNKLETWEKCVEEEFKMFESSFPKMRVWQLNDEKLMDKFAQKKLSILEDIGVGSKPEEYNFCRKVVLLENQKPDFVAVKVIENQNEELVTLESKLPGDHNAGNLALAVGVAIACGIKSESLAQNWQNFSPPEMRSEVLNIGIDAVLYNDCYNSSPSSFKAGVQTFFEKYVNSSETRYENAIIVLGDMLDLGTESEKWHKNAARILIEQIGIFSEFANSQTIHLCLFGNSMYTTFKELKSEEHIESTEPSKFVSNFVLHVGQRKICVEHLAAEQNPNGFGVFLKSLQGFEAPKNAKQMLPKSGGTCVMVKGSRGMKLDRVVNFLKGFQSTKS